MESIIKELWHGNIIPQESYIEHAEAYTALFQDQSKYNAIMVALAEILYREFNRKD